MDKIVKDQSDWSADLNYFNLLLKLLYEADIYQQSLDVFNWFHTLLTLYTELSTWMSEDVKAEKIAEINRINNKVCLFVADANRRGNKGVPNDLYMDLFKFGLFIRDVYKASGLQTRIKEDPGMRSLK